MNLAIISGFHLVISQIPTNLAEQHLAEVGADGAPRINMPRAKDKKVLTDFITNTLVRTRGHVIFKVPMPVPRRNDDHSELGTLRDLALMYNVRIMAIADVQQDESEYWRLDFPFMAVKELFDSVYVVYEEEKQVKVLVSQDPKIEEGSIFLIGTK